MFDLTHQELKNVLLGVQLQRSAHIAEKDRFNLATSVFKIEFTSSN
jgi:hypothetical protein